MAKCLALIPLRGGSKGIPGKNIKLLAGKPLAAWVLEAAVDSGNFEGVFVSTDSEEISNVVLNMDLGVKVLSRPVEFATDIASTESVMMHFINHFDCDTLVTIQATSPLLTARDIDLALKQFKDQGLDSMLSAVRTKRFFWADNGKALNYDPLSRPRRQDFPGTLMENGSFYVTKREVLERYKCRLGGKIGIYEMDEATSAEIDEVGDWDVVERLLLRRQFR